MWISMFQGAGGTRCSLGASPPRWGRLAARLAKAAGDRADQHFFGSYVIATPKRATLNSF